MTYGLDRRHHHDLHLQLSLLLLSLIINTALIIHTCSPLAQQPGFRGATVIFCGSCHRCRRYGRRLHLN